MNYYIPDPQKWIHYYEQLTKEEYNPHMNNSNRKPYKRADPLIIQLSVLWIHSTTNRYNRQVRR
jgi:hypothetical protein